MSASQPLYPIQIREDSRGNIYWTGVREVIVNTFDDVLSQLVYGGERRRVGSTDMNEKSSRSHAIFSVALKREVWNNDESGNWTTTNSKFHFVDLAGSERLKRTNAIGERAKEGISINAGLSALGNVISVLGDYTKKNVHVPYRGYSYFD